MSRDEGNGVLDRFRQLMGERKMAIDSAAPVIGGEVRWLFELRPHQAFTKAARAVLESGGLFAPQPSLRTGFQEIATPCAYLQRHALESVIKEYLLLAGTLGEKLGLPALAPDAVVGHNLETLILRANARMAALRAQTRQPTVPTDICELAREISAIEAGDASAFRYEKSKHGNPSIPTPVVVPIADWQARLEAITEDMSLSNLDRVKSDELTTYQWMAIYETCRSLDSGFMM